MKYLGIDVGTRRSGIAYADSDADIVFSLETVSHTSEQQLLDAAVHLVSEKMIDVVILGLPLLPSGEEGAQAHIVHHFGKLLSDAGIPYEFCDERYTSSRNAGFDPDAASACEILHVQLQRIKQN